MTDLLERLRAAIDDAERLANFMPPFPFGPVGLLAMVAAHREILELHPAVRSNPTASGGVCRKCAADPPYDYMAAVWPCSTLLALAKGYGIEVEA